MASKNFHFAITATSEYWGLGFKAPGSVVHTRIRFGFEGFRVARNFVAFLVRLTDTKGPFVVVGNRRFRSLVEECGEIRRVLLLLPSVGYGGEIDKKTRDEGRLVKSWEMEAGEARELWKAAAEGNVERVQSLLESGADVCEGNDEGLTPLIMAAQNGHAEVVRALLRAGAPWNALNLAGKCAGDFAMEAGHQEAFDVLLDAGMQAELILGVVARQTKRAEDGEKPYLQQRVEYSEGKLTDEENKGVMMAWENPLMAAHAKAICANGGHVLNVGFGMGLVDTAIQSHNPASHTIIEAHPEVYKRMLETGWGEKPNVRILFGRWQDVLPQLNSYDGIFFDTYGEFYDDLKEFHEHLPKILKKGGIYSYFNGLCATNAFFHVVYCQLVALELARLGLTTQFIPLPVKDCLDEETWLGVYHKYWQLDTYFLPVCQAEEDENEEDTVNAS